MDLLRDRCPSHLFCVPMVFLAGAEGDVAEAVGEGLISRSGTFFGANPFNLSGLDMLRLTPYPVVHESSSSHGCRCFAGWMQTPEL